MDWLLYVVIAIVLVAVFWTPLKRVFGRVKDEADSMSRTVAGGNPLATLGRGITDNQQALDKSLEAIGHWDALVKSTTQGVNKTRSELASIDKQIEDRFAQHEQESRNPSGDKSLLTAIEADVERLNSERDLKTKHLQSLEESLKNYEVELEQREAALYEINRAIEDAKRVHHVGKERERLQEIEDAARAAGKNVGIDGVGAAQSLAELVEAVKRNQQARESASEYRGKMTQTGKPSDPRLLARDRERSIKDTFEKLRAERQKKQSAG